MARKPKKSNDSEFVLFDVIYQDGAQSSNRRIPRTALEGLDEKDAARGIIEEQDRKIAEMSGNPRGPIKTISRSPGQ